MIRKEVSQKIFYLTDDEVEKAIIAYIGVNGFTPNADERPFVSAGKGSATVTFQTTRNL